MTVDAGPCLGADLEFLRARRRPRGATSGTPIGIVDLFSGCGSLTIGAIEGARRRGRPAHLELAVDVWASALEVLELSLAAAEKTAELDLGHVLGGLYDAPPRETEEQIVRAGGD